MRAGLRFSFVVSLFSVVSCNTPPVVGTPDAAVPACTSDADCDDAVFCNGEELCRPRAEGARPNGCVAAPTERCLASQTCDETGGRCVSDCAVARDADMDGATAVDCGGDDCDDADPQRYPSALEICDEGNHDEDCDTTTFGDRDFDHDGDPDLRCCNVRDDDPTMLNCGDDCNDLRRVVNPSTTEACDRFDNDCDGMIDEEVVVDGYLDADRDGVGTGAPARVCAGTVGMALEGGDCDDADPARRPGGPELCDGRDNDCDAMVDESPTAVTWYRDLDGDLYGNARSGTVVSCTPVDGFSLLGTDCDDRRRGVSPAAAEACNGIDDDCNGLADYEAMPGDFEDDDGDGFLDTACGALGDDCDDLEPATHPGATEICDGRDNDCNGVGDDLTGMIAWYPDVDGDGWGDSLRDPISSCVQPAGRTSRALDCDDSDPDRHPETADLCDETDTDCDDEVDEDAPVTLYWTGDVDDDGYAGGTAVASCSPVAGATTLGGDCDDTRPDRAPGATEACNGFDDDCDTTVDEGFGSVTCGMASCVRSVPACMGGATTVCVPGTPAPEACNGLDDDCNGVIDDPVATVAVCTLSGASSECRSGACRISSCDVGYADCNTTPSDGCEAQLSSSPTHCGRCGNACPAGDACTNGHCENEIVDLVLGDHHSCALLGDGHVYCWGGNERGQVGANTTVTDYPMANLVTRCDGSGACPELLGARGISSSRNTTCVHRSSLHIPEQRLVCWGDDAEGQIGLPSLFGNFTVSGTYNLSFFGAGVAQTVLGPTWQLVREVDGATYFAGTDTRGSMLGTCGSPSINSVFVPGPRAPLTRVTDLRCGDTFCFARDASSATMTFGWGDNGGGVFPSAMAAICAPTPFDLGAWSELDAGRAHVCLVRSPSTEVVCMGDNTNGQLGAGDLAAHAGVFVPTGTSGSIDVDAYGDTTCAVNDGAEVACWGRNDFGQVGTAGPAPVSSPSTVPLAGRARRVAVGGRHACAVLETNQVVCWGRNLYGELGNGTHTSSATPVYVLGLP